jgi:hypothetical protein
MERKLSVAKTLNPQKEIRLDRKTTPCASPSRYVPQGWMRELLGLPETVGIGKMYPPYGWPVITRTGHREKNAEADFCV